MPHAQEVDAVGISSDDLIITEIHYNPPAVGATPATSSSSSSFKTSANHIGLNGMFIEGKIDHTFSNVTLAAGQYGS